MAGNTRTLKLVIAGDPKGAVDAFGKTERAAGGFESKMSKVGSTVGKALAVGGAVGIAGVGLVSLGSQVLTLGGQVETYRRKSATVFEGQAKDIAKWADKNAASFGLTDDELTGLAASFGDLLKPMGFTSSQAAGMSKDVVGLAGALSSWTGGQKSASDVADTLAKAMLGERDELKGLGISISQAEVDAKLLAKGQNKLTGAALQQAQALVTQELIFAKSTDAQKAWAAGGTKALMTQNKMSAAFKEVKETLATKLTPVVVAFGDYLLRTMPKVSKFVQEHAAAFKVLAGVVGGVMLVAMLAYAASAAAAAAATIAATWPILAIGAAIAALAAGVIYAYKHWKTFHDVVDAVGRFIKGTVWPLIQQFARGVADQFRTMVRVVASLMSGVRTYIVNPVRSAIGTVKGYLGGLTSTFHGIPGRIAAGLQGVWSAITAPFRKAFDWIRSAASHLKIPSIGGVHIPGFASGTMSAPSGYAIVGEAGPELVRFGGGERVYSASATSAMVSGGRPVGASAGGSQVFELYIDGVQVEAVVRRRAQDREARTGKAWTA